MKRLTPKEARESGIWPEVTNMISQFAKDMEYDEEDLELEEEDDKIVITHKSGSRFSLHIGKLDNPTERDINLN